MTGVVAWATRDLGHVVKYATHATVEKRVNNFSDITKLRPKIYT